MKDAINLNVVKLLFNKEYTTNCLLKNTSLKKVAAYYCFVPG